MPEINIARIYLLNTTLNSLHKFEKSSQKLLSRPRMSALFLYSDTHMNENNIRPSWWNMKHDPKHMCKCKYHDNHGTCINKLASRLMLKPEFKDDSNSLGPTKAKYHGR